MTYFFKEFEIWSIREKSVQISNLVLKIDQIINNPLYLKNQIKEER
jgi:hypothetical protein